MSNGKTRIRQISESVKIPNNSKSVSDFIEIFKLEIINNEFHITRFSLYLSKAPNLLNEFQNSK